MVLGVKRVRRCADTGGEDDATEARTVISVMWAIKTPFVLNANVQPHGARQEDRAPQSARAGGRQARSQQDGRSRCRYGANCDRVVNCPHLHSTQDFPMYNKNQGFRKTNSNNQNW